jgi:predicted anti-sigma-YlaC factor YlaD
MKDCLSPDRIFLYLEGELEPGERRACEEHLGRCPGCRAAFEERRLLHEAFSSLPPLEVPPNFARSVMAGIPGDAVTAWRRIAAAALAFASGLLGFHLLTGKSLTGVLLSPSRGLGAGLSDLLPFLAKALKSAGLALELLFELVSTLAGGLGVLSSVIRPGLAGPAIGLGLILSVLLLFGAGRLLAHGEKP